MINPANNNTSKSLQEDIARFLVLDYFNNFKLASGTTLSLVEIETALAKQRAALIEKYRPYKSIFYLLDTLSLLWLRVFGRPRKRILFQNTKFPLIISGAQKKYSVGIIAQGKKDRFFAFKNGMGYMAINDLDQLVLDYLTDKNLSHLHKLMEIIEQRLKKSRANYVVLRGDGLPLERAIVLASRKLGITTLVVQHGMYDSFYPSIDEKVTDYALVWGNYFKDVLVSQGRRAESIYILGYPYALQKPEPRNGGNSKRVCYLGQNFEAYDKNLLEVKLVTIESLAKMCKELGLEFIYRPHPGDNVELLKEKLPQISFTQRGETLPETLKNNDIFISCTSTALIEAAMRSKRSLQLSNFPVKSDNFEELGVCDKTFRTIEEVNGYLSKIAQLADFSSHPFVFNRRYIEISYDPGQRLLEILSDIEKRKNHAD